MAELIPAPFASLLRRLVRELQHEGKLFDLPARRFWRGAPDLDTSVAMHGRRAANPVGPAAGPHGQMAQNIALSWLAGSRILELKTVQAQDRLRIPRPCIDMTNVGYNVEWSQELRLEESLREYVKGSMLIDVLRQTDLLGHASERPKAETLVDLSVGYDLAGIRSERVRAWIASMRDARAEVGALRRQIPDDLRGLRDLDFTTAISDQVTLSTFHGCPAAEIEALARCLLTEMDLHVTVKLNPTLLSRAQVDGLLHEVLGYDEIRTRPEDFAKDLQWEAALDLIDRSSELARSLGRTFRIKLSNTLVVRNHRAFFPPGEGVMYLSGAPLHVLTLHLVEQLRRARPELPVSFSAGVDSHNFPDCVALGFVPVTTCTDLLKPGGYGRLPRYLEQLEQRMRALGVRNVCDYVVVAAGQGGRAVRDAVPPSPLREALLASLGSGHVDLAAVLAAHGQAGLHERLAQAAAALNAPVLVAQATADPRYRAQRNRATPRKIGTRLNLFDCINCDKCLPVCPNDANFVYETHPFESDYVDYRVEHGAVVEVPGGRFAVREEHQIANFQDFCNDCGNCDVFCPEDGGPYVEKPRFFGSLEAWQESHERDGLFARRAAGQDQAWARLRGVEYRLRVDRGRDLGLFTDGVIELELQHSRRRPLRATAPAEAPEGHRLDFAAYLSLAVSVDGVLDARRANPVNALVAVPAPRGRRDGSRRARVRTKNL
jgi:putative selenate reductase